MHRLSKGSAILILVSWWFAIRGEVARRKLEDDWSSVGSQTVWKMEPRMEFQTVSAHSNAPVIMFSGWSCQFGAPYHNRKNSETFSHIIT